MDEYDWTSGIVNYDPMYQPGLNAPTLKFNRDDLIYSTVSYDYGTIAGYRGDGIYIIQEYEGTTTHEAHESQLKRARKSHIGWVKK